jgi:cytosine/adenosine deaminase-related metal-dependent hydrolase
MSIDTPTLQAYRASLLHFHADPAFAEGAHAWHADGLLIVEDGRVKAAGDYAQLAATLPAGVDVIDYRGKIITPGFIDTHLHFPQTDMIASPAPGLLPWLENFTFPTERQFRDPVHARASAEFFLDELLRNGTTTALVYCTVHKESVDAFFEAASKRNLRMGAGKVLMDRHCPDFLQDTADLRESEALINRWHKVGKGEGRSMYAITPRFAPTSTDAQLAATGELASLGTDVGAGTSFSILQTMNEAYKVARLKGSYLPALRMFYLATLGAARSMQLEGTIGNFVPGAEADFIVLDPKSTPLLERRTAHSNTLEETLFALALLGDDRAIRATYAAGKLVHERTLP